MGGGRRKRRRRREEEEEEEEEGADTTLETKNPRVNVGNKKKQSLSLRISR